MKKGVFLVLMGVAVSMMPVTASADTTEKKKVVRHMKKEQTKVERHERTKRIDYDRTGKKRYNDPRNKIVKKRYIDTRNKIIHTTKSTNRVIRHWPNHRITVLPHRRPGYTVRHLPTAAFSIVFGSAVFMFHDGLFYERHPFGYVIVNPPVGVVVPILPAGYVSIRLGGSYYYYYDNIYYVWDARRTGYRVVEPPVVVDDSGEYDGAFYVPGNVLDALPDGAQSVTVEGVQYYAYDGHYFLPSVQNGKIVYIVVNLDGR